MKLFAIFLVVFFCSIAQSVKASCYELRTDPVTRQQVAVQVPGKCKNSQEQGDGIYNGRRKVGIGLGCVVGGFIAHYLGGSGGEVAGACIGGAQAGTYIGSTFDQDAQLRDQIELNRSRCGAGTYYSTVSGQCESDRVLAETVPQVLQASQQEKSFKTIKDAQAYCASLVSGGFFDPETGSCLVQRKAGGGRQSR